MITENLSNLKIHRLTQKQFDKVLADGNIDETALYLTPDRSISVWQPNTEYKVGDVVIAVLEDVNTVTSSGYDDGYMTVVAKCKYEHTSNNEHSYIQYLGESTYWEILQNINAYYDALGRPIHNTYATKEELGVVDQNYNPESENAQSGKALAEALAELNALSNNDVAQSTGESETAVMSQKAVSNFFSKKTPPIELTITAGEFAMETGAKGTYADSQHSDFIPVKEGERYKVTTWAGAAVPAVVFYQDTPKFSPGQFKGMVGQVTEQTYFEELEFTIPSNVMYMVVNAKKSVSSFTPTLRKVSSEYIDNVPNELEKIQADVDGYATLKGRTIVNLGDSIFGQEVRDERNPVSKLLGEYTGATVINCAFGGTRMTSRGADSAFNAFDFPSITQAIVTKDFTTQEETLATDNAGSNVIPYQYDRILPNLKAVDWSNVDVVTLNYGTNDYTSNVPLETFKSSAITNLSALMEKYPHITFVLITPTWRFWYNTDGTYMEDSTARVNGGNNLVAFCEADKEIATSLNINLINAYNIGINKYNRVHYFPTAELDGVHHAENGRKRLAKYLSSQLMSIV